MKWIKSERMDGRLEYICEHGVGHGNHVHGCCGYGCCSRDDYPFKERRSKVATKIDKITVTFYDDDECVVSKEFRGILKHQGISMNAALKSIIKQYITDFNKGKIFNSPTL